MIKSNRMTWNTDRSTIVLGCNRMIPNGTRERISISI